VLGSVQLWNDDMSRPDRPILVRTEPGTAHHCGRVKFGGVLGDRVPGRTGRPARSRPAGRRRRRALPEPDRLRTADPRRDGGPARTHPDPDRAPTRPPASRSPAERSPASRRPGTSRARAAGQLTTRPPPRRPTSPSKGRIRCGTTTNAHSCWRS
jgi:hypothetical protein